MPSTFLSLTNQLLRKFNETELTEGNFAGARGIQARAKDAIVNTIDKIQQRAWNWPFNAKQIQEDLIVGQEEYSFPADLQRVDWDSFQIQQNDELGVSFKKLRIKDREDWYEKYRDTDDGAYTNGRSVPDFVFPSHGFGYGVTPSPNQAYAIRYRYWTKQPRLVNSSDISTIPDQYDYVIISGAAVDMHNFYDNAEAASIMRSEFADNFSLMRNILLNNYNALRDRRVNFGARSGRSIYFWDR